ncbi:phosphatidylserine decarboxylase proenzyme [Clostridium tepidiprofundi DSM 19306]|uniref:Phosphatidylserine decarboxylase proenzyme n=1 Tax=Clostridium tepidiprofundi DSM 19306 TaxID=1121338 RepID=A0A151B460_9CLOT|nr:phosphatidylserine decarboxylase [Clostridium tepidiprofundi]KYH34699.1 phosphatidylserine decarboxylase proenzyme [Clostridium tepidiprofundi DSM 19306]
MDIYYIERATGKRKKEIVAGDRFLRWIYDTKVGNAILETLVKKKVFSVIYGKFQDFSFSRKKIKAFIQDFQIDMSEAEREHAYEYSNFNDFFTRKLKKKSRPISMNVEHLISPADGRVLAYENIDKDKVIQVKGSYYKLRDLLYDDNIANEYDKGVCIVIRLCPSDYHRFHFPDSGTAYESKKIKGQYYSVNPIALNKIVDLYCQNKREITLFESDNFGEMILCEVGATCVGSIIQTYNAGQHVEKGEEKGYFKFGGSTVILFLKSGQIKIDEDICANTKLGIETKVNMGERLGRKIW